MTYTADDIIRNISGAFESLEMILEDKGIESCEKLDAAEAKTNEGKLWQQLKRLADGGKICEAENLLFDALEEHTTPLCLKVARMFYAEINALADERLAECDFSRREIMDGMWDAEHVFMSKEEAVG